MNKLLLFISLILIFNHSDAQKSLDIGFASGVTNYFGDLGNDEFLQASSLRPGVAITVRNFISPNTLSGKKYSAFNVEARFSWNRIGYDESKSVDGKSGVELRNYGRGLNFRNDLFGLATHISYTYYPNRRLPLYKQSVALFVFAGVGVYYGRPKADLFNGSIDIKNRYYFCSDGTIRDADQASGSGEVIEKDGKYETDLIDWQTESQVNGTEPKSLNKQYSPWNVGIPIGGGFRYGINKAVTFSIEFGYYKFLTDYIDDVSDKYATYSEIEKRYPNDFNQQELAKYISDPTGKGTDGTNGPATSRRGNPKIKDSYSFINMEIAYKFNWNPKKLTAMFARR